MIHWRLITDDGVSASFGLAADDCLATRVGAGESQPTLRLYTYRSHCALVGRFQNVDHEVHREYCLAHGISINRRPTGGGAILMGADQLGVALTLPGTGDDSYHRARELMARFSQGIVIALQSLGIPASFRRKNDIEVNGRKIVGLGIYRAHAPVQPASAPSTPPRSGLLFHASLLVGLDIPLMLRVLKTPFEKISDKEIATVADRITTVRREMGCEVELDEVRARVAEGYTAAFGVSLVPGDFTSVEREAISHLQSRKYDTAEWVNQTTAVADMTGSAKVKTPGGLLDVRVTLAGNTLKAVFIGGDFFAAEGAIADLEAGLRWQSAEPRAVAARLAHLYAARASDLATIPLDALTQAVQQAIRRAQVAESVARADPYGCFVNPESAYA
ncbi:MAG: biotin/lipoate A/B protein ligase family protein [Anaerolineales bacterium]|nr:biotin/lipoate A/B protein ligase family protein [Anaerolineales bacterium]